MLIPHPVPPGTLRERYNTQSTHWVRTGAGKKPSCPLTIQECTHTTSTRTPGQGWELTAQESQCLHSPPRLFVGYKNLFTTPLVSAFTTNSSTLCVSQRVFFFF